MADPISIDDLKAPPASTPVATAPVPLTIDDLTVSPVSPSVGLMRDLGPYGAATGAITPDTGAVDAMARGLRQFQLGLANTLDKLGFEGAAEWRDGLQTMMAFNQQRYNPEGASFLERGLEGTTAMLPSIAVGAVAAVATGGAAIPAEVSALGTAAVTAWRASRVLKASMLAGSVAMEAQQYGDFYDEIDRASGGRLTPEQLHGLAFSRSVIDATLENVIPAEAILSVGAANISKAVAGRWLKTEGGKDSLELVGRSIFGFPMAGGFGRFALAFPGELLEEGAQQANGSLFDAYASGQPVDLMAVAAESYDAMIQAIPTVTMMVGMGAFVGAAKKEAVKRQTMAGVGEAETVDHPHWRAVDEVLYGVQQPDGSTAVDPALKQKEADTVTALTELWSKNGAQAARESAQLVVQLAKNLAVQDRAAGNVSAQAWDYTDGLSVGFGDMALADISTIRDMRAGGATGSQLLDFMLKASPAFANSIDSVFQKRETIRLTRENEVLRGTLKTVLRGTNPKAVLEGVDPKAISGRLKTAVDTYGLPDPTDPSEARIRIIPAPVVKAALGNRSLAAALAAQPMIVSPFGWEGVLEVRADGSATLTPVRPKKGKGAKAPIAGAPPVEAGAEAAQITAEAKQVEQDIRHQLVMRSVPTTVVGEAGPTLPTQTAQARLAEVERGTLEAAQGAATDPNVEHATALRENLRLRHQNLMMENFGANWDAIPAAVAPEKPPEWKAADLSSRALPEYVDVEAQAAEMLRQMEVSGVTEVEDQLTALKNAAKAVGVQVAANENALSIARKIVEAKAKAEAAVAVKPEQPEQLTLLQDGKELSGLYLPDRALMVYFRSADAGTFIHEWLHHVTTQRLLPSAIERTLLNAYGTDEDRRRGYIGSQQAHEDIANSLLLYIRDGQLPDNVDGEILKAFEHLKGVMKGSYSVLEAYTPGARGAALAQERRVPSDVSASDARYLELAKDPEKNKVELQRMVDEAAKAEGYTISGYHGTGDNFTEFDLEHPNRMDTGWLGTGVYLFSGDAKAKSEARDYSILKSDKSENRRVLELVAKLKNPYRATLADKERFMLLSSRDKIEARHAADVWTRELKTKEHDGVILDYGEYRPGVQEVVVFDTHAVKSADPITRDDQGNVIPLSQRFNAGESDIRFQDRSASSGTPLELPGSISDLFGNLLSDVVPSESQQIAGETAAAGMQRNPPSQAEGELEIEVGEALGGFAQERDIPQNAVAAEVGVRFNGSLRVEELHDDYYTDDAETGGTFAVPAGSDATAVRAALESMRQRFAANPPLAQEKHKRPEGVSKESMAKTRAFRAALNNRAVATAAELGYNIKSLYDLGLDDSGKFNNDLYQQRINEINSILKGRARSVKGVRRQLLKESALAKEGEAIGAAIKDELRAQPDSIEELSYGAKGGPKFFYWAMKAVKGGYRAISRFWNTMETTALFFSAGNYKSAFYDLYWRRTNADTNAVSELNIKRANEDIAAGMLNINRFNKVNLGGQEYLLTHALAFYAAADGKKIRYSLSQLSEKVEAAVAKGDLSTLSEAEKKIYTLTQSNVMGNYRVTLAAINDAVDLVANSPKYMALMSYTQKQMGVAHGWMDTAMKAIYDRGLPKRPGLYMTFQREDGHDDYMDTFEDPLKLEAFARGAPLPSYVKARSQMRGSAVSIDYLGAYDRYMATMANASTRLPTVLQQLQVLRDKGEGSVWHLIGRKYGTDTDQMGTARMKMLQNLEEQAQATMRISGRTRPPTDTDLWIRNKIRIPSSVATLGVKPWIAVSQFLSTVSAMSEIPVLGALADMRSAIAWTLRSTASQMREDAGKIARGEQVIPQDLPLAGHPDFERMAAKSPLLRSMLGEWELLEAQAKKPNVLDRLARQYGVGHSFIDAAFKAMRVADQINKYTIFKGAYTAKKSELLDQGLSEAAAEAQAIEYGEGVVRDHIPIANNTLRTLFHNSPEIVRLFSPFSSQPITYINQIQRKYIIPFMNAYRMAEGGNFDKWKAAFGTQVTKEQLRRTLFMFVLPAILWNALQRRRPPDKEELVTDILLSPFSMIPLVGDVVQQARMGFSDIRQGDVRVPGMIPFYDAGRMIRAINGFYKAAQGEDIDWSRQIKDFMALPSDIAGLPKYLTMAVPEVIRIREEGADQRDRVQQAAFYLLFGGAPKEKRD